MSDEQRFERVERELDEIRSLLKGVAELQNDSAKRHEDFRQNHESWLLDMQSGIRELAAAQLVTEERLQRLIRALNASHRTNGHVKD